MKKLLLFISVSFACLYLKAQITFPSTDFYTVDATNTDQWTEPVGALFSKDGLQLFVWEKRGRVYVNNRQNPSGNYNRQNLPVIDISPEVGDWADFGLLGFTYHPDFANNHYIYLFYVVDRHHLLTGGLAANGYNPSLNHYWAATIGRIARYTTSIVDGNLVADPASRKILLGETITTGMPVLHKSHSVGSLAFAADGTLLATTGDGASYDDTDVGAITNDDPNIHNNTYHADALADGIITLKEDVGAFRSQMLSSLNGKLLRLDAETGDGVSSNPFFDATAPRSAKSRTWALGFRNPFRMSVKPGTGSTNPSAGDIGEVFVGDVGFGLSEELNIVKAPGQNFGWPIYEGNGPSSDPGKSYWGYMYVKNRDEINPFYPALCDRDTLNFHELLKQDNAARNSDVYLPFNCTPNQVVASGIRHIHARPAIDWAHVPDKVYVSRYDANGDAIWPIIGTPESNVVATNSSFEGNASTGGIWYTGTGNSFPSEYNNTFLVSDFGGRWIRRLGIDYTDVVTTVDDFATNANGVVCMTENPIDGSIVYITVGLAAYDYGTQSSVKRIIYGGNKPPEAKITADNYYSPNPTLTVNFNGSTSNDPDGNISTYAWDFGDPGSGLDNLSILANPSHEFSTTPGVPRMFNVILTVTDDEGATDEKTFIVSINNTPPQVNITSPVNNSKYMLGSDTAYELKADVTDTPGQLLTYAWQTSLIHNNHSHPGTIDPNEETTANIARIGCNDTYSWLIQLTVTDDAGLSTLAESRIYPNCNNALPLILHKFSVTQKASVNLVKWTTELESNIEYFEVERSENGINFYPINRQDARNIAGASHYSYNDGNFAAGYNYYRLKMVEHGSIIRYSVVVRTLTEDENLKLKIVPNPVVGNFSVMYKSSQDDMVTIQIRDIAGRLLHTLKESVSRGQNVIYLQNLPNWPSGVYFLSIQNKDQVKQTKFVKAK